MSECLGRETAHEVCARQDAEATLGPDALSHRWVIAGLAVFALLWSWALFARNVSVTVPMIIGDEYFYRCQSRPEFGREAIERTLQAPLPRTIYLALMRVTTFDHGTGYVVAKGINVFFFTLSLIPLYIIARRVLGREVPAAIVAAAGLMFPFNQYTSTYMPESMYGFFFWLIVAAFLGMAGARRAWLWALVAGVCTGFHFMVKPHGVILLIAMCAAAAGLAVTRRGARGLLDSMGHAAVLLTGFLSTIFVLSWAVSGESQMDLGLYRIFLPQLAHTTGTTGVSNLPALISTVASHLSLLTGIFAALVPAVFAATAIAARDVRRGVDGIARARASFLFLMATYLVLQVFLVSQFTVQHGEIGRIHFRYYDFAFPVFPLVLAIAGGSSWPKWLRITCSVIGAAAVLYFWLWTTAHSPDALVAASTYDSPDLVVVNSGPLLKWALLLVAALFCVAFAVGQGSAAVVGSTYIGLLVASCLYLSFERIHPVSRAAQLFRTTGEWLQSVVPPHHRSRGLTIGPEIAFIYSSQFFFEGAPEIRLFPQGQVVDLDRLALSYQWLHIMPRTRYVLLNALCYPSLTSEGGTLVDLSGAAVLGALPADCRIRWMGGFTEDARSRDRNDHSCTGQGVIEVVSTRSDAFPVRAEMLVRAAPPNPITMEVRWGTGQDILSVSGVPVEVRLDLILQPGPNRIDFLAHTIAESGSSEPARFVTAGFHLLNPDDSSAFAPSASAPRPDRARRRRPASSD